jgi:indole-3-glycerol phosphate synthase
MAVLVEAHDGAEVERALNVGARIVGVNSRDLATFNENLAGASSLVSMIPSPIIGVAESSIRSVEDAAGVARAGFDAVLVGEALVRASDPTALVRDFAAVSVTRRTV